MRLFFLRWYARQWAVKHGCKIAIVRGSTQAVLETKAGIRFSTDLIQGRNLPAFGIPALARSLNYQLHRVEVR